MCIYRTQRITAIELAFTFIHTAEGDKEKNHSHDKSDKDPICYTETKHLASSLTPQIEQFLSQ